MTFVNIVMESSQKQPPKMILQTFRFLMAASCRGLEVIKSYNIKLKKEIAESKLVPLKFDLA